MNISVLIPVYRDCKRMHDIVEKLLRCTYSDREIIVAVDGVTNERIEAALDPFRGYITVVYNGQQLGKAATLNRIALNLETDVLLLLDNDIDLPSDTKYLDKLAKRMEQNDIAEVPKEGVRRRLVSRMMAIEFLTFAMTSLTMASCAGESPSMNGAAFAVRADLFKKLGGFAPVMNEDMDFAARAYRLKARFCFPAELKARNDVPDTVPDWIAQRKRWAMNNVLWIKQNFGLILTSLVTKPALFVSTLIMLLPFLTSLVVYFLARKTYITLLIPLFFLTSQHFHVLTGMLFIPSQLHLVARGAWLATIAGAGVAASVYFVFSRILKFHFNLLDFLLFYFLYSPVWLVSNIIMFIVMIFKLDVDIDWKVVKG